MASYQKRGATWRVSIARKGQRVTGTFDTRAQAEQWAVATEAAIMAGQRAEKAAGLSATKMADLFDKYALEVSPSKGGARWEVLRLKALARDFTLFSKPITEVTPDELAKWRKTRLTQVSAHTVNREMNLVSAVYQHALREWRTPGLLTNPVRSIKRPIIPPPRQQRIRNADRDALLAALGWDGTGRPTTTSQWTAWTFAVALETAMRKGELLNLRWRHVHLAERWVHLTKTKNGTSRDVPLSTAAVKLFALLAPSKPDDIVVRVTSGHLDGLFRDAKVKIGLGHIRFHDARREALTGMASKVTLLELARISGHKTVKVLSDTYYAPDASDLAKKLG